MKSRQVFEVLEKAEKIQAMIHQKACCIADAKSDLYHYDNSPDPFHPVKLFNTREKLAMRLAWHNVVKARLQHYFDATVMPLCIDIMQRNLPVTNQVQLAESYYLSERF